MHTRKNSTTVSMYTTHSQRHMLSQSSGDVFPSLFCPQTRLFLVYSVGTYKQKPPVMSTEHTLSRSKLIRLLCECVSFLNTPKYTVPSQINITYHNVSNNLSNNVALRSDLSHLHYKKCITTAEKHPSLLLINSFSRDTES